MKCEYCPAYRSTSYEYGEYECYAGVPEEKTHEFNDGLWGCTLTLKNINKRIAEHDSVWEMTDEQALEFLRGGNNDIKTMADANMEN